MPTGYKFIPEGAALGAPATDCNAITPHASDNIKDAGGREVLARSIYVGVTGNIALVTPDGNVVTFSNVPVGVLPVCAKRINAVNTTATNMVALF